MKRLRLSIPAPCASRALAATFGLLSGLSASATVLSLPGIGWQLPEAEGGNPALGAGGAGKDFSSLASLARTSAAEEAREAEIATPALETDPTPDVSLPGTRPQRPQPSGKPRPRPVRRAPGPERDSAPAEGKGLAPLDVPAAPLPDNRPTLFLTTGWSNKLYFRGLDIFDRVSPNDATGALTNRVKITKGGWEFGAQYLQALDTQLPDRDALAIEPNLTDPATGLPNPLASDYENFRVPPKDRYAELDLWLSYTRPIGAGFSGTVGATYYHFLNRQFWGISNAFELQAALSYSRFKYVEPSLLYAYDFNGFEGGYAEFTVTAKNLPYWSLFSPDTGMTWSIVPYAKLAYDFAYNGDDDGWNHAELGVNIPVSISKHFALNLNGAWIEDLGDDSGGRDRADSGWWVGLSLSTATRLGAFPGGEATSYDGKGNVVLTTPPETDWSFSGGTGWRSLGADFRNRSQSFVPALSTVTPQADRGELGFATSAADKVYEDGTVHSNTQPGTLAGTSGFTGGEVTGTRADRDQQVRFHSRRYIYSNVLESFERNASVDDDILSPYFRLEREVMNVGGARLSVGIMYSYNGAEFDSGTELSSLDKASELFQHYHYLYDVNELDDRDARLPGANVIFDDEAMAADPFFAGNQNAQDFYATRDPQDALVEVLTEVKRVGTFVGSDLDVSLHALSLPVSLQWAISDRAHFSVSAGPTVNLFDADLTTYAWARELDNLSGGRVVTNTTGNLLIRSGAPFTTDFVEGNQTAPKTGGTSSGIPGSPNTPSNSESFGAGSVAPVRPAAPATPVIPPVRPPNPGTPGVPGSGKGGTARAPRLPGIDRGSRSVSQSEADFEFGAFAQASFIYDLDQKDRWFIEAWGRYDYVNKFSISNGQGSANVDASSWGFGAGVGMRF